MLHIIYLVYIHIKIIILLINLLRITVHQNHGRSSFFYSIDCSPGALHSVSEELWCECISRTTKNDGILFRIRKLFSLSIFLYPLSLLYFLCVCCSLHYSFSLLPPPTSFPFSHTSTLFLTSNFATMENYSG